MVTGGLGFIGSNLARRLVDLGADVLLVDSLVAETGANRYNIAEIEDQASPPARSTCATPWRWSGWSTART